MSKKVLVIVGLAAVIALSAGVVVLVNGQGGEKASDNPAGSVPASAATAAPPADLTEADDVTEATEAATDAPTQPSSAEGSDSFGVGDAIVSAGDYHIASVYEHATGASCSPRQVFGKSWSECFLSFSADHTFRLYLNPASGEVRTGTYQIFDDVISAQYDNGSGTEFNIWLKEDSAEIDCIIVNYGDYDVYFS